MAYDEFLADRIRSILKYKGITYDELKMMGGLGFMVDNKHCIGIYKGELMCRVHPDKMENYIKRKGARQMVHGGRPFKGYLTISEDGFDLDNDLEYWIKACLDFNPLAKSSKKR